MAVKTVVDIAELYYGDVDIDAIAAAGSIESYIKAFLNTASKIENVHADTFDYTEEEASTTDFVNQLKKLTYYIDPTPGSVTMSFSIGQYEYQTKADLVGGTATATGWERPRQSSIIYKSMLAVTKDRTYIFIPKAMIDARSEMIESKVHGLALTATMLDTGTDSVSPEYWREESVILSAA